MAAVEALMLWPAALPATDSTVTGAPLREGQIGEAFPEAFHAL